MVSLDEKVAALGFKKEDPTSFEFAKAMLTIASEAESLVDFGGRARERGYGSSDNYQRLMPIFTPLYQRLSEAKAAATVKLAKLGFPNSFINETLIEEYFTSMGNQPYFLIRFITDHGKIPEEQKDSFSDAAIETMFQVVKAYAQNKLAPVN